MKRPFSWESSWDVIHNVSLDNITDAGKIVLSRRMGGIWTV